jgi:prephenate dehydratase
MCQTPLIICGEIKLRVRQNLLSNARSLAEVTRVYSHAQSLAQCVQWLARHLPAAPRVAVASNAEAARLAARGTGNPRRLQAKSRQRSTGSGVLAPPYRGRAN